MSRYIKGEPLTFAKAVRWVFASDTLIVTTLILLYCLAMSVGVFILAWLVYRERYGITLMDFFRLNF